jgi:GxxExxY protein
MALDYSELAHRVIGCAIDVHRRLGPGLLRSVYRHSFARMLDLRRISYTTHLPVPIVLPDARVECAYRADFVIEQSLLVEVQCVQALHPVHIRQAVTHLKLLHLRRGLLINFNVPILRHGIRQVLNPDVEE